MKRELLKNKIYAVILILFGILMTFLLEGDATFLLLAVLMGAVIFVSKESWIVDDEWEDYYEER